MMSNALPPSQGGEASGGFLRSFAHRPRLIAGAVLMVVTYFAFPYEVREPTRLLIAWNVGAWAFLALIGLMMASPRSDARVDSAPEDENQWVLLVVGIVAACAATAAIIWELGPVKDLTGYPKAGHVALVAATILSAWTFIHMMFTLHYAGRYYAPGPDGICGGLKFPGNTDPGWQEFLYQAFVIGCAFATADVNVTSTRMRRVCLIHSVVGFFFNAIILALTINISAGLI
jgi:uncharacterized membrane protein